MGGGNSKKDKKKKEEEAEGEGGKVKEKKVKFKVGMTVYCKMKADTKWSKGTVVSAKPLLVDGKAWDEVRKDAPDGAGPGGPGGGVKVKKEKVVLDDKTEDYLKSTALQLLLESRNDGGKSFNAALDWLFPKEFDVAAEDFKTSETAKELPYQDKVNLKALMKQIKEGDASMDDAPNFHLDPDGAQRWKAHYELMGMDSGTAKREFADMWRRLKKEFGDDAMKVKEESRVFITRTLYASQGEKYKVEQGWKGTVVSIDDGNALVSFDHPSVEKYVCEKQFKYLRIMKIAHKDRHEAGSYVIDTENLTVDSEYDKKKSKQLGKLARGRRIVVVEVVKKGYKVRGRIADFPGPGWIALANLRTGKRFAVCTVPGVSRGIYRNDVRQDVYEGVEPTSKKLHKLDAGLNVNVVEVVATKNGHGLRARVVSPYTGWITLMWDGSEFAQLEEADAEGSDHEDGGEDELHPAATDTRNRDAFKDLDEYIANIEDRFNGIATNNKELRTEVNACRKQKKKGAKSNNTPKAAH